MLNEHTNYTLFANRSASGSVNASLFMTDSPTTSHTYMSVLLVVVLLWPLACVGLFSWKKRAQQQQAATTTTTAAFRSHAIDSDIHLDEMLREPIPSVVISTPLQSTKKPRIVSLDVFRGITIFAMIFVNLGGGEFWYFKHATWNGLTVADVVFPFFVWIMGVTMNIGMSSHAKKGTALHKMLLDAVMRSIRLFLLGLLLVNDFRSLHGGRIPGVLQSFAFAYLMVSLAVVAGLACKSDRFRHLQRVVESLVMFVVVAANLGIAFLLPVPGCPTGYFGPGGLGDGGLYANCTGGAHLLVDLTIFGESYMGTGGTQASVYDTNGPWDPEGALNWLMVSFMAYIGYVVGGLFLQATNWKHKIGTLVSVGVVLALVGLALCEFKKNGGFIPINKNLWSLSFVLAVSGLACGALAVVYLLVDHFAVWGGTPFRENGMNAIALYIGHEILIDHTPFSWDRDTSSHIENLLSNLGGALCWTVVALWMHQAGIFITV
ncbi:hypothetical protein, variant [Aphanomyces invadans]|nr:hypothetical protein, variant [Aphanomyces invadans]ETV99365.1 hypothetical protein, variant [Aphanomyces invadans]|eukprot:XP_008871921.1 hypothetical protein, variant [Aphanomyces invadans]